MDKVEEANKNQPGSSWSGVGGLPGARHNSSTTMNDFSDEEEEPLSEDSGFWSEEEERLMKKFDENIEKQLKIVNDGANDTSAGSSKSTFVPKESFGVPHQKGTEADADTVEHSGKDDKDTNADLSSSSSNHASAKETCSPAAAASPTTQSPRVSHEEHVSTDGLSRLVLQVPKESKPVKKTQRRPIVNW